MIIFSLFIKHFNGLSVNRNEYMWTFKYLCFIFKNERIYSLEIHFLAGKLNMLYLLKKLFGFI